VKKSLLHTAASAVVRSSWFNPLLNGLLFIALMVMAVHSFGVVGVALAAAPMRSTDFRAIVEPILNQAFDGIYDQRRDEYKQVFSEETGIARSYHEEPVMFGFGTAPELPDGMPVTYQQGGILFQKRYLYKVYGLAFALTKVLVEDGDHVRIGTTYSKHLAQSLMETLETLCANELNRAFNGSYVGGDGVTLSNSAHPIQLGSFSNILATPAALSQTSLEQALIQIRQAVDNNGKKIRLMPKKLVIAPGNVFQAEVLLKSVLRAGTNNNDINPVKSMNMLSGDPAVLSRLTSPIAWWVQTDAQNGMKCLWRRKPDGGMEGDFETDSMRYKKLMRLATGWTDPRCMYGTQGA
jgi:hypothetical protein